MPSRPLVAIAALLLSSAAAADEWQWATETAASLERAPESSPESLLAHCGAPDRALQRVAEKLIERKQRDLPYLDSDGLTFAERVMGAPYVWPRAWIVSAKALSHDDLAKRLDVWRAGFKDEGTRLCGLARGKAKDGTEIVAAIAVDAPATMDPIPTRARTGQWITLRAAMHVPASGARVVLLAPNEAPRNLPSSFANGTVTSRFALTRPGEFTVQVLADLAGGPRPVLEANLFADVDPPPFTPDLAAPGEDAANGATGETALLAMVGALRKGAALPPLKRSVDLDKLARAHAEEMKRAKKVAHNLGHGDPSERVEAAGLTARETGENVAHAQSVKLAHRALYASPSHRANLLKKEFTHVGIAVIDDPDGSVWACEVFTRE